jgi:hypothetical protein
MPLPNFLIIGAAKSGSTALYHHLRQHPDIFMPERKEPRFWGAEGHVHDWQGPDGGMNQSINNMAEYLRLFDGAEGFKAIGEASPTIGSRTAPQMIHHHIPDVRMIAILRQPADRAFSSYCHMLREGLEPCTFEQGLAEEAGRRAAKWSPLFWYKEMGYYGRELAFWMEHFPREQFRIYIYDDFRENPLAVVRDAFTFLQVDPAFEPELARVNVSGVPRSRVLYDLLRKDNLIKKLMKPLFPRKIRDRIQASNRRHNVGPKPVLNPETRRKLTEEFREDILLLQDLAGRDLSTWLEDAGGSRTVHPHLSRASRPDGAP